MHQLGIKRCLEVEDLYNPIQVMKLTDSTFRPVGLPKL
jgi:hypothetical protein